MILSPALSLYSSCMRLSVNEIQKQKAHESHKEFTDPSACHLAAPVVPKCVRSTPGRDILLAFHPRNPPPSLAFLPMSEFPYAGGCVHGPWQSRSVDIVAESEGCSITVPGILSLLHLCFHPICIPSAPLSCRLIAQRQIYAPSVSVLGIYVTPS